MTRICILLLATILTASGAETAAINGEFHSTGYGLKKPLPKDAPTKGPADWTMNFWVKPDGAPKAETLIAGFGNGKNDTGKQRYLGVFTDGLRFWGSSIDIKTNTPLEAGKWQMLTATSQGGVVHVFKDGKEIGSGPAALKDAAGEVNLGPVSPWASQEAFGGRIAKFTLLDRAMTPEEVAALVGTAGNLDGLTYEEGRPEQWPLQHPRPANWVPGNPNQKPETFPRPSASLALPKETLLPRTNGDVEIAGNWRLIEAPKLSEGGAELSQPGYKAQKYWYDATVPGTVLTTLVDQGVYPDPYFGLNNLAIPESLSRQDYWYRVEFTPPADWAGKTVTLCFNGINYRAEAWLNGTKIGQIAGAFTRGVFPLGATLKPGVPNALAVKISPAPNPGTAHEQSIAAGAGGNGGAMCLDGPTFFCTEGWDWIPGIRDRDTGIWQSVTLRATGPVTISDPQAITHIPEPIGTKAEVTVLADLKNETNTPQSGVLKAEFEGVSVQQPFSLAAGEQKTVRFSPKEFPALNVAQPRLWWPNGYGKPELYHLRLTTTDATGRASDTKQSRFGMREVSVVLTAAKGANYDLGRYEFSPTLAGPKEVVKHDHASLINSRKGWVPTLADDAMMSPALKAVKDPNNDRFLMVKVNGAPIAIRGGNWGMDDAMKRISRDRLEPYIRLERDANFNTIRNWCGQSTSEDFYDLCDEYGILVWNEFWLTTQNNNLEPTDANLLLANARDSILRYRIHPSIALWCGRNEGVPPPAINEGLDRLIRELDGTRYYQPDSNAINMTGSGPWWYNDPMKFYGGMGRGFSTELGLPSPLSADSIRSFMTPRDTWPVNDVWAYHDFVPESAMKANLFMGVMAEQFGAPTDLEDFVRKAQMLNYTGHRAMFEGMNANLWKPTTGRLLWMSHPSWPSFVWQIYGWNYEANASLFGVKKACEPVHVQMNLPDGVVLVSNTTLQPLEKVKATATVYDVSAKVVAQKDATLDVPADDTATTFAIDPPQDGTVQFVKLELRDAKGRFLSDNFYWRAKKDADYQALNQLPTVELNVETTIERTEKGNKVTVTVTNPSSSLAVMTDLVLRNARNGQRILPAYASDNYISFVPGEKRTVTIETGASNVPLELGVGGWNIAPATVQIK